MSFCREVNLNEVCKYLKKHNDYLILTHNSPDGDTLGSAYALALGLISIGKRAYVVCNDPIPAKYDYFVEKAGLHPIDYKTVIAVDVADAKLLGSLYDNYADKIMLDIDHHISNTRFAQNLYLDASAAATAECIYAILKKLRVKLTPLMATALYTGITTDTGCFRQTNTTSKSHIIAAELYKYGIDAAEINRRMFNTKSKNRIELEGMVLDTADFLFDNRCLILTATAEMQRKTGCGQSDLEGVAEISRSVEGVLCGVSIKQSLEEDNTYKISLRTYEPLDASEICKTLGGGGHKGAAGCTLVGELDSVKKQIADAVGKALENL